MTQVVELYVVMYCEDCATSVKRVVKKIPGVESYKIDYYGQKVTVVGNVDRDDVWRRIHKTGRHVMLIADVAPPKEEPKKEEKKEETKEEKKEEHKEETKLEEKTKVKVEEQKTKETKIVETQEDVKVEEVVTVVETKKEEEKQEEPKVEDKREETKAEAKKEEAKKEEAKKKEPERPKEPEWVPMFVSAPYYTLPNRFYNY